MERASRQRAPLVFLLVLFGANRNANASELLHAWANRTARIDSLYCRGRIEQFRVPLEKDPTQQRNWESRPGICPTNDFEIWLRRPEYRIHVESFDPHDSTQRRQVQFFARLDGKLYMRSGIDGDEEHWGASINPEGRLALLSIAPYLTPLEFHFFDYPADDVPQVIAKLPSHAEANTITFELVKRDPGLNQDTWLGLLEIDPQRAFLPIRSALWIEDLPPHEPLWEMTTLETSDIAGLPVVTRARIVLFNPAVLPNERVVYLWQATQLEQRVLTRADVTLEFPKGTRVSDRVTQTEFVVGDPNSVEKMDPELYRKVGEALAAQLATPAIRARRTGAMNWIIAGAGIVTLLLLFVRWKMSRQV